MITGASSGIGLALADALADAGTRVVLVARREPALRRVAEAIGARGGEALVRPLDVSRTDEACAAIREIDREVGGLDLVIANAGVGATPGHPPYAWEAMAAALHTNVCGAAVTLTAALPAMIERRRGHLVGLSSLASFGALPAAASYCAPKAGLSMLLECLRLDLHGSGVAVTTIHAGFVRTPMIEEGHPTPQRMEPEAFARAVCARLPRRPACIDIPQPLALTMRILGRLPRGLRRAILRRFERGPGATAR
ncbi:MAG: SDR family NAD(P)-dependent oxidoreductase [Nannocystaceae bacterium]